jgi:adenylosuccinate lyase
VYPERMRANLESSGGLVFSGQLLLDLVEQGVLREEAYSWVQRNAMRAWNEGLNFRELVLEDPDIRARVPREQIERAFDLARQLRNVNRIFKRVFGSTDETRTKAPVAPARPQRTKRQRRRGGRG